MDILSQAVQPPPSEFETGLIHIGVDTQVNESKYGRIFA